MAVETDGKGNFLMHIERFVCGDGTVEEKKFFDYALACEWRRRAIQTLDDAGCAYTHEADSEWVPEDGGWLVIGSTAADSERIVGEVIQHKIYAVGYYTKDVDPRIHGGIAGIRSAALDLADTDVEEMARFTSLAEARNFLSTRRSSMRSFSSAGMTWYSADVYWLYAIIIDEDGGEEIGEFIDAAEWEPES